jgi:hypothetical protein
MKTSLTIRAALLALALSAVALAATPEILVLSNRADLISGGDALIEIRWPAGASASSETVTLNGMPVTPGFAVRTNGRYMGLVTGMKDGANVVLARYSGGAAQITITNHPIGGPVFSGPQVQPWVCQTEGITGGRGGPGGSGGPGRGIGPGGGSGGLAGRGGPGGPGGGRGGGIPAPSLGRAQDAQCNAPTVFYYAYKTTANQFAAYDPAKPRPDDMATTTTDAGVTADYIVRIERGTMDRGIHEIAVLYDPSKPWTLWAKQPQWNGKLYIPFGAGCEFSHSQGNPASVLNDMALSRGFMVASSSNTQYGTHCNDVTSAETVMMLKEHITETYGEIRFTVSTGGSGGAHQQNLLSSDYPGLLQGIMPSQHFQDTWTPYREFADCGLLARYYAQQTAAGTPWTEAQKARTDGHATASICEGPVNTFMASRTLAYLGPQVSQGCEGNAWTWSPANPIGVRCTLQDYQEAIFGKRAPDATDPVGYAKRPLDNAGLQYGLVALKNGDITPQMFVDLNAAIGCYDINANWQPQRCQADPGSVKIAYSSGRITNGKQMAKVAMIDLRDNDDREEHYNFRTYVTRARLIKANGTAANQAIWRGTDGGGRNGALAFDTMNEWLTKVEADKSNATTEQKIVKDRPALAADTCFEGTTPVDASKCDAVYHTFTDTRVAAGEPTASDIMKCQLKPLNRADYGTVSFTPEQWTKLQSAFPTGVCDYSKPGVDQVTPAPWQTFANGPGGQPLGSAPVSAAVR